MKKNFCIIFCMLILANTTAVFANQGATSQYSIDAKSINPASRIVEQKKNNSKSFLEQLMAHSLEH